MRAVLVTGGSNGIGRATVLRFARGGDRVWFTYRLGKARADDLLDQLRREGVEEVEAFEFDQGDWESHERLLAELPGAVDVLVNNAAVGSATVSRYAGEGRPEQDRAMLTINALGPLWLTNQVLPGMLDRGYGKIVNIASVGGGISQFPGFRLADGMSKAAMAHMTRQLAAELAHSLVDVFALCPGAVHTEMLEASTLGHLSPDSRRDLLHRLPRRRLIEPEEIADVVWWLCQQPARVLHGAVIDASMGLGVHPGLLTAFDSAHAEEPAGAAGANRSR
jgi:NAD(P)-dependent dehydrogenase (short-subunit alcohol dehydrogenase family)